ncbi:DUF4129 domain-containing protein [Mucilaginibacter arboris]|uniref:DUF4129 domain-containing protein n=1 Tax=Mucilaginibacter arboris TaxID=2682090 RepID=A0A7K1SV31_9SPHI|nr:DUF4129 domain-containing protein [Mucilaginibacter arboris]MVN21202.1 DUF4129 domain-containing protein [Mucilaginibacter arboris]
MYKVICLLFCFFISASFTTQKHAVKEASAVLKTDSSALTIRHFNAASLEDYRQHRDFKYVDHPGEGISLWDQFWRWFWYWIDNLMAGKVTGSIMQLLFIILGAGALVFMVLKLMGMDMMQIFTGKTSTVEIPYQESIENIHEISFEEEIEKAISNRNFRLAVRLLYLNCLKKLSDAGAIQWKADKTNQAYLHELKNPEQQQKFGLLTRQFEYVWYGDFKVDQEHFQQIRNSFQQFNPKLR